MKRSVRLTSILFVFLCCLVLISKSHAAAEPLPFFRMNASSYKAGTIMEITLFHVEDVQGEKYLEIVWDDTGNIILRLKADHSVFSLPAPAVEGSYTLQLVLETEILSQKFTVTDSRADTCALRGEVKQNEQGQILGVLLQWEDIDFDRTYYVTRTQVDGNSVAYGPIYTENWLDTNIDPNMTYIYSVSDGFTVSNNVILDLTNFVHAEYVRNHNTGSIVLNVNSPYMIVNNTCGVQIDPQNINVEPIIMQDRVMLPIRALVETMGGTVTWDGKTRTVVLTAWERTVEVPVGSNTIRVNGEPREFDVPAMIEHDRTLVPVRHLESLGCEVEWIKETRSVLICYHVDEDASTQNP